MVFSTCVEVIPSLSVNGLSSMCILHVCGGDPMYWEIVRREEKYSPRVEVILPTLKKMQSQKRILHVCGGDPDRNEADFIRCVYSPRVWR